MPVKINIDQHKVQVRVETAWKNGLEMLSTEILNDCNQYCKEDTGALILSSYIHSKLDQGLLIWQTPYARRQYWEIKTAYKDVNSNATMKWAHYAKTKHCKQWERQAQIALKKFL